MLQFLAVDWNGTVVPWFGEEPYPGALEALSQARASGLKLAVVSHATPRQIETDVARVGLVADEVHGVSAKSPVLIGLTARWGKGAMIGDSGQDARAALDAQVPFLQACLEGASNFSAGIGRMQDWDEFGAWLAALQA